MQRDPRVCDIHKPGKENKLFPQGNVKEDTGHVKRECFRLEKDIKEIGVRKDEKGKGARETDEKTSARCIKGL